MSEKLHSFHSNGGGDVSVILAPGSYRLVAHHDANPRVGATQPPATTEPDIGLTVSDSAGAVVRPGPGDFPIEKDGSFIVSFGPVPKVVELWQVAPGGAGTASNPALPPTPPTANVAPGSPETAPGAV